ncbi:TlpA disulfide reductase family protein [Flaviaesturariibacter flavus]|uniref:TlpA disulfide reductase family protein n=1 Tax=Flaviaesturariibacter flavus TaxID=2502780 RepID=UPI001404CA95|nr:TlpA disulfide reductase family protein [Flaviaesturariibacter flavus]
MLALLLFPFVAGAQRGSAHIEGTLVNLPRVRYVSLRTINGSFVLVKPVEVRDGHYSLRYSLTQPLLVLLTFTGDEPLLRQNGVGDRVYNVPVFLQPGTIEIESRDTLPRTVIRGSRAHTDYLQIRDAGDAYEAALRKVREYSADPARRNDRLVQRRAARLIDSLGLQYRDEVLGRFLQRHIDSPIAPWVLTQFWNSEGDPEKVLGFLLNLPRSVRNRYPLADMEEYARHLARMRIGDELPDFSMRDTAGREVSLSSFRGKWVLLDFWGSWCLPCRLESGNLVKAFSRFKERNFTILSVAIEPQKSYRKYWMEAIRDDSLTWTHVADFKFWDSKVLKRFGVQAIPFNLLIDPQGRVVARYLRGERLFARLDQYLE